MITTLITIMAIITSNFMMNSTNPMKASFKVLTVSAMMFLHLKVETGSVWFPLIFFILFTGGILMMFMILSSILPNEKALKMKVPKMMGVYLILVITTITFKNFMEKENLGQMKSMLTSGLLFSLMATVILMYFFNSMNINSMEEYSMRSFQC